MTGNQTSTGVRPLLGSIVIFAVIGCAILCSAQPRAGDKSKIQRVTSRRALSQIEKAAQSAVEKKVRAQIERERKTLAPAEREIKKQADQLEAAFRRQRGAEAFLNEYRSAVASLERARSSRARQKAISLIARQFTANRALTNETMTAAKTDLKQLVAVSTRPMSGLHGPLVPKITKDGGIIWVVDDGGNSGGNSGNTGNNSQDAEPFEPQPTDFCLAGNFSQSYNDYLFDDEGANSTLDAADGEMVSDIYVVQGLNPTGDSNWNWIYLGEVFTVPAGHTSLRVSADLTYSREWSIQAVGHAQAAGWLELNLAELSQSGGSVDIGSIAADDTDRHELGARWVVAGQDDIPPPDQPPSPVDVTLDITRTIPNSQRSYLVFVGGIFRADAVGIAASAHAKTNITIHQICIRAEP